MLGKILLISLMGVCCANIFQSFRDLKPIRNNIEKFAINIPDQINKEVNSNVGSRAKDLLSKVRNSLLMGGSPMGPARTQQTLPFMNLLPATRTGDSGKRMNLKTFAITNCSESQAQKSTFVVRQINITPNNPVPLPGTLTFSFDINILQDISSLNVALELYFKSGGNWIKVPCLGMIGSCNYDICDVLSTVSQCPDELIKHKIDCKCPFAKGQYTEPGLSAQIDADVFPTGEYKANGTLTQGGDFVGCYAADFTIEAA